MFKLASWIGGSLSAAVFVASVTVVGIERAIAEVAFSINDIGKEISRQIDFPILLPSADILDRHKSLVGSGDVLYAAVPDISKNSKYEIIFNNSPGNPGNAAFRFSFSATKGGKIARKPPQADPKYQAKYNQLKLVDGSPALVTAWCGGTACWSSVQWISSNILYEAVSKIRQPDAAIEIANYAIKAGDRLLKTNTQP